jgi:hypothetical protein
MYLNYLEEAVLAAQVARLFGVADAKERASRSSSSSE